MSIRSSCYALLVATVVATACSAPASTACESACAKADLCAETDGTIDNCTASCVDQIGSYESYACRDAFERFVSCTARLSCEEHRTWNGDDIPAACAADYDVARRACSSDASLMTDAGPRRDAGAGDAGAPDAGDAG